METTTEERRNGEETFKYEVVKSPMEYAENAKNGMVRRTGKGNNEARGVKYGGYPSNSVLVPVQAATQVVIGDADSRWTYAGLLGCGAMVADPQLNQGDHVTDSLEAYTKLKVQALPCALVATKYRSRTTFAP